MELGERIYQLRTGTGLSQGDLAERLDVSRQSVSKWENGTAVPDLEHLMKLCDLFGISLDELAGRRSDSVKTSTLAQNNPSTPTSKVVGYILLAVSLVGALLLIWSQLYHLLLVVAAPLLISSILCLVLTRHAGYWCLWTVWLTMEFMLVFGVSIVTGARLFPGFAGILLVIIGVVAWHSFREVTVRICRRNSGLLLLAWLGYLALTIGLYYWVFCYGFIGGVTDLLVCYVVSAGMSALLAGLFTYTICFIRNAVKKKENKKGC